MSFNESSPGRVTKSTRGTRPRSKVGKYKQVCAHSGPNLGTIIRDTVAPAWSHIPVKPCISAASKKKRPPSQQVCGMCLSEASMVSTSPRISSSEHSLATTSAMTPRKTSLITAQCGALDGCAREVPTRSSRLPNESDLCRNPKALSVSPDIQTRAQSHGRHNKRSTESLQDTRARPGIA